MVIGTSEIVEASVDVAISIVREVSVLVSVPMVNGICFKVGLSITEIALFGFVKVSVL